MQTRREFLRGVVPALLAAEALSARGGPSSAVTRHSVRVPLDHDDREGPRIELPYLVCEPFDTSRQTVFVVADGQQFYVRPDVLGSFRELFGPDVNIVGLAGRGTAADLLDRLGDPRTGDWSQAYALLRFPQWLADIDALRKALLGEAGKPMIYGVSGGGQLAHQYLARYGVNVSRCYTEAAVFSMLEAKLGLQHDRFWSELPPDLQTSLQEAVSKRPEQRAFYAQLLQRQHFFVELQALPAARKELIGAIGANDAPRLREAAEKYQVRALNEMMSSPAAWAIRVRQYEFVHPLAEPVDARSPFRPDIETSTFWARPLLDLHARGAIPAPTIDLSACHTLATEVTLIAGRYDHTCDYRSQIALASHYPRHTLLILADDHRLQRWKSTAGLRQRLLRSWPLGFSHPEFAAALSACEPLRWREH